MNRSEAIRTERAAILDRIRAALDELDTQLVSDALLNEIRNLDARCVALDDELFDLDLSDLSEVFS